MVDFDAFCTRLMQARERQMVRDSLHCLKSFILESCPEPDHKNVVSRSISRKVPLWTPAKRDPWRASGQGFPGRLWMKLWDQNFMTHRKTSSCAKLLIWRISLGGLWISFERFWAISRSTQMVSYRNRLNFCAAPILGLWRSERCTLVTLVSNDFYIMVDVYDSKV